MSSDISRRELLRAAGGATFLALIPTGRLAFPFALPSAANREYVVQGPEPMSYNEAARKFARAAAARPLVVRLPLSILRLAGLMSPEMRFNANMMETVLSYPEVFKAEKTWRDLGQPTTAIEEFVRSL